MQLLPRRETLCLFACTNVVNVVGVNIAIAVNAASINASANALAMQYLDRSAVTRIRVVAASARLWAYSPPSRRREHTRAHQGTPEHTRAMTHDDC